MKGKGRSRGGQEESVLSEWCGSGQLVYVCGRRPVQPTCLWFAGGLSSLLWSLWSYTVRTHGSELKHREGVKDKKAAITQNNAGFEREAPEMSS